MGAYSASATVVIWRTTSTRCTPASPTSAAWVVQSSPRRATLCSARARPRAQCSLRVGRRMRAGSAASARTSSARRRQLERPPPGGHPFVFAVGGVDGADNEIYNARPKSTPRLVAPSEHAVALVPAGTKYMDEQGASVELLESQPTRRLTGTSVSAAVASAAAALVWSYRGKLTAPEVMELVYNGAEDLSPQTSRVGAPDPVHRISLCGALTAACKGGADRCPASLPSCAAPKAFLGTPSTLPKWLENELGQTVQVGSAARLHAHHLPYHPHRRLSQCADRSWTRAAALVDAGMQHLPHARPSPRFSSKRDVRAHRQPEGVGANRYEPSRARALVHGFGLRGRRPTLGVACPRRSTWTRPTSCATLPSPEAQPILLWSSRLTDPDTGLTTSVTVPIAATR